MASDQHFVDFVVEQLEQAGEVSSRAMFGGHTIYCQGKVVALVTDNRLFVKPTAAGRSFIGTVVEAPPYPGARLAFLIEDQLDDKAWMGQLISLTENELPLPKPKKKRKSKP